MGFFNFSKTDRNVEQTSATLQDLQPPHNEVRERSDEGGADEVFTVPVKAGKRIYYFDVKATRAEDYYITITESRKKQMRDGSFIIDKHKIHLYKEDFAKFAEGFEAVVAYVRQHRPDFFDNSATELSEQQNENAI